MKEKNKIIKILHFVNLIKLFIILHAKIFHNYKFIVKYQIPKFKLEIK